MATQPELIAQAADPLTPPAQLATLAHQHAELRAAIAVNPAAYDGLLEWLGALGDPAVDAALALRKGGATLPPPPPPPPAAVIAAPHQPALPRTPWVEPTRAIALTWGTYPLRYGIGLVLFLVAPVLALQYSLPTLLLATLALAGAIVVMPSTTPAKVRAAVFGGSAALVLGLVLALALGMLGFFLFPLVFAAWVASWLALRMRPDVAFALLPFALLSLVAGRLVYGLPLTALLLLVGAGIAWWARALAARRKSPTANATTMPAGSVSSTNTLAILALIFGIGGGLLGIIFGHTARAQIRRTGEQGWGLATAGLVLGYIGLAVSVVVVIVYVVFIIAASR